MKSKPKVRLLTHRSVATMLDVDTETLRDWVAAGEFPEPRSIVAQTWFYDARAVEQFVERGTWPEGTRFKPGAGRGRGGR